MLGLLKLATPAVMLGLLAACASGTSAGGAGSGAAPAAPPATGTPAQQQALARYTAYAGPDLAYFTWLGYFYQWEPLGKDQLVVFTTTNEAYLLSVWPPCDLRFAVHTIGVSSKSRSVYARADSIVVDGRRCPIGEIRKIDYPRMKADMKAQADGRAQQATPAPPQR
jgi:uncharacterized protein DUF6491